MGVALVSTLLLCLVADEQDSRYEFVQDLKRDVCIWRAGWMVCGRLDERGEFTETKRLKSGGFISGSMKVGIILNGSSLEGASVYELRSGSLVPGTFDEKGYFVSEVGGKVIKFIDYKFTSFAPVIWNLPGEFVKKNSK